MLPMDLLRDLMRPFSIRIFVSITPTFWMTTEALEISTSHEFCINLLCALFYKVERTERIYVYALLSCLITTSYNSTRSREEIGIFPLSGVNNGLGRYSIRNHKLDRIQ